ncbi:hypothetical protein RCH23_001549 [Cryobacterium sp. CAN_C3]|nr:hypothetical protein [Cryobacterium sp. CAN_C3]
MPAPSVLDVRVTGGVVRGIRAPHPIVAWSG